MIMSIISPRETHDYRDYNLLVPGTTKSPPTNKNHYCTRRRSTPSYTRSSSRPAPITASFHRSSAFLGGFGGMSYTAHLKVVVTVVVGFSRPSPSPTYLLPRSFHLMRVVYAPSIL